jgi:transcriptional regulator with XRE-family HTH domain
VTDSGSTRYRLPNSSREQLGSRLRDLRVRAGLTGDALATETGLSQSKISRVERGLSLPSVDEVRTWATACHATQDDLAALSILLEQVATSATSWRISHRLGLAERQEEIADLESRARHIQTFQPAMIPGLLQTADYARRMLTDAFPGATAPDIQARLERQSILYEAAKRFDFIITEAALRWSPPGVNLNAQLSYVSSMQTLPNVSIRMLPTGAPSPPVLHPFVIWHLEDEALVSVETYSAELWVREAADIERYRAVWSQFAEAAQEMT